MTFARCASRETPRSACLSVDTRRYATVLVTVATVAGVAMVLSGEWAARADAAQRVHWFGLVHGNSTARASVSAIRAPAHTGVHVQPAWPGQPCACSPRAGSSARRARADDASEALSTATDAAWRLSTTAAVETGSRSTDHPASATRGLVGGPRGGARRSRRR